MTYLVKPDVDKDTATSLAKQTAYNVSKLLDSLLKDYDNSLRPDFGGIDKEYFQCSFYKVNLRPTRIDRG